eukprot:3125169-Rhodomonas_salina.2
MKFPEDFMDLPLHAQTLNQLTDHARRVSDSIELFEDPTGGGETVSAEGEKLQGFAYLSHGHWQAQASQVSLVQRVCWIPACSRGGGARP